MKFDILHQRPCDHPLIEPLLDRCFGFDRHHKTVYRMREGLAPLEELSFVALAPDSGLLGSLRFWPIRIGAAPAILLGPLAVEPALQGAGVGRGLLRHGLTRAKRLGAEICVVVGAPDYYAPFGFENAAGRGLILPGPGRARALPSARNRPRRARRRHRPDRKSRSGGRPREIPSIRRRRVISAPRGTRRRGRRRV